VLLWQPKPSMHPEVQEWVSHCPFALQITSDPFEQASAVAGVQTPTHAPFTQALEGQMVCVVDSPSALHVLSALRAVHVTLLGVHPQRPAWQVRPVPQAASATHSSLVLSHCSGRCIRPQRSVSPGLQALPQQTNPPSVLIAQASVYDAATSV
jgi:hypothetical protein